MLVPSTADEAESTRISTLIPTVLPPVTVYHWVAGVTTAPTSCREGETRRYCGGVDQDFRRGYPAELGRSGHDLSNSHQDNQRTQPSL